LPTTVGGTQLCLVTHPVDKISYQIFQKGRSGEFQTGLFAYSFTLVMLRERSEVAASPKLKDRIAPGFCDCGL
jgi:hypothetical protein